MFYFSCPNTKPLLHLSSGNLISHRPFLHLARNLDSYVLLFGCQGTLFLEQDGHSLELNPGQFLLLFPGVPHRGTKPSAPGLSYYWCHFRPDGGVLPLQTADDGYRPDTHRLQTNYLLPEKGTLATPDRAALLFRQLLDTARRGGVPVSADYALSLLVLELSQALYGVSDFFPSSADHTKLSEIIAYIQENIDLPFSVQQIADTFSYHPDYLSSLFKAHTGMPLLQYALHIRIANAKQLLLNSSLSIKEIAGACGFEDPKYFMKRFKSFSGLTPTQYRSAFEQKHVNSR